MRQPFEVLQKTNQQIVVSVLSGFFASRELGCLTVLPLPTLFSSSPTPDHRIREDKACDWAVGRPDQKDGTNGCPPGRANPPHPEPPAVLSYFPRRDCKMETAEGEVVGWLLSVRERSRYSYYFEKESLQSEWVVRYPTFREQRDLLALCW